MKRVVIVLTVMATILVLASCHNSTETGKDRSKVSSNTKFVTAEGDVPVSSQKGSESESSAISSQQTDAVKPPADSETSKANTSAASSASTASSRPKPPTASSAPQNPSSSSSAPPAAESSAPQEPDEPEPEQPEERDPYAYPFDIEAIRQDLIKYGESLGMKHITEWKYDTFDADGNLIHVKEDITPENSSWAIPSVISREWKANKVKKELFEYLEYDFNKYHMTSFTIYTEPLADGAWRIYVLR